MKYFKIPIGVVCNSVRPIQYEKQLVHRLGFIPYILKRFFKYVKMRFTPNRKRFHTKYVKTHYTTSRTRIEVWFVHKWKHWIIPRYFYWILKKIETFHDLQNGSRENSRNIQNTKNIKIEAIHTLGGINVYDERTHYYVTITPKRLGSEFGECRFDNNGCVRNANEISVKKIGGTRRKTFLEQRWLLLLLLLLAALLTHRTCAPVPLSVVTARQTTCVLMARGRGEKTKTIAPWIFMCTAGPVCACNTPNCA